MLEISKHPHEVFTLRREKNHVERDTNPEQKRAEILEFDANPEFSNFRIWRMSFRCEVSSSACRPIEALAWIHEIESAKSMADMTTSYAIIRAKLSELRVVSRNH